MPSFDEALQRAGEFGSFQRRVFLLLCLTGVTFAFLFVGVVFLGSQPERYWCRGPSAAALAERCGWSPEEEWNRTAPPERRGDGSCRRYLLEAANASAAADALSCADPLAAFPNRSAPLVPCRGGWRYAQAHSTIVSEVRTPPAALGVGGPAGRHCALPPPDAARAGSRPPRPGPGGRHLPGASGDRPGASHSRKRGVRNAGKMPVVDFPRRRSGRRGAVVSGVTHSWGNAELGDASQAPPQASGRPIHVPYCRDGFVQKWEIIVRLAVETRGLRGERLGWAGPDCSVVFGGKGRAKRQLAAQMMMGNARGTEVKDPRGRDFGKTALGQRATSEKNWEG